MDKYSYIANAHGNYVEELFRSYKDDPNSVDDSWKRFFEGFEFSLNFDGNENGHSSNGVATPAVDSDLFTKERRVRNLIFAYRRRGHLEAKTNPVRERKNRRALLELKDFGLTEADLDTTFSAGVAITGKAMTLREIVAAMKEIYTSSIGFEYSYIRENEIWDWLKNKIEKESLSYKPTQERSQRILSKLNEAVVFENFLHTKYIGQKRFSLEGAETTIPALDAMISKSASLGVKEVVIGMAHRGRLNVLVNILGKTYEDVFNEFEGNIPEEASHGDGDVKYHMGFASEVEAEDGKKINLQLAPNPSHLEAVDPVVQGFVRAECDGQYQGDIDKIMPILIHGDAAIAGQGLVYEVTQMSKLKGYFTGGTIHFVINNQVGFTTDFEDARSSIYCTDVAKIIDAPVLHVNGDNPEAVVFCCNLAAEFRERFNRDIFIDMVCYRKYGHNESDEPKFTQPKLYNLIAKHKNPREIYAEKLKERGEDYTKLAKEMEKDFRKQLQDRLDMVKQKASPYKLQPLEKEWTKLRPSKPTDFDRSPETGISEELVNKIGKALTHLPKNFKPLKQIKRLVKERERMFFTDKTLDWASAELLAYGSILTENKIVRISGQDVKRGTFSHRHSTFFDSESNDPYIGLDYIQAEQENFHIHNSFLSEYAVLGFEYGYALANPNALVIWEAQFGDFANGAQVMIDQFIAAAESKWQRMNGLVMLLPHGYEGQGPEHSNARPERFLQLAAEYNMIIANVTKSSNFFHLLRRQLAWEFRKPLIVMSPKSLLRNSQVESPIEEFTKGAFQEVIGDNYVEDKKVKKVLLCTGKVYYDLYKEQQEQERKDVAIIRIEQLHPFPAKAVHHEITKYNKAKHFWVQEEPANMGAWSYIQLVYTYDKLQVISRKASASPATGYSHVHKLEQAEIVKKAFS